MKTLLLFVTVPALLGMCGRETTPEVTATEEEICRVWQDSLPTRSTNDTQETRDSISIAYDQFEAVCQRPAFPG